MGIFWVNKWIYLSGPNSLILESGWTSHGPKAQRALAPAQQLSRPQKAPVISPARNVYSCLDRWDSQQRLCPPGGPLKLLQSFHKGLTLRVGKCARVGVRRVETYLFCPSCPCCLPAGLAGFARLCPGDQYEVSIVSVCVLGLRVWGAGVSCHCFIRISNCLFFSFIFVYFEKKNKPMRKFEKTPTYSSSRHQF